MILKLIPSREYFSIPLIWDWTCNLVFLIWFVDENLGKTDTIGFLERFLLTFLAALENLAASWVLAILPDEKWHMSTQLPCPHYPCWSGYVCRVNKFFLTTDVWIKPIDAILSRDNCPNRASQTCWPTEPWEKNKRLAALHQNVSELALDAEWAKWGSTGHWTASNAENGPTLQ